MRIYEDLEAERDRIQACLQKFGWTSDHNLDWFIDAAITIEARPLYVEFDDGAGLLTHKYNDQWRIWSDPLSPKPQAADKIEEFSKFALGEVKEVWCDDVADTIYSVLENKNSFKLYKYYSLYWSVLDMARYDPSLPGGHFKEIRNARNKFHREHKVKVVEAKNFNQHELLRIVDDWTGEVTKKQKEDVYDLRYRLVVKNNFRGFPASRVIIADGIAIGFNAGFDVPNHNKRFAGTIGIHDYSLKDLGIILWLEDLEWIKKAGYKEVDMGGMEYEWELKTKLVYGATIERKSDTFSISKK